jgi:putative heme-binding domain-containing protein
VLSLTLAWLLAQEAWADPALPVKDGLELWLDATRPGPEDVWPDASGRKRELRAPSPDARPRRLKTSFSFDGKDDRLVARGLPELRDFTLVLVAAPRSNAGFYRALASANAPGKNDYVTGFNLDLGGAPSPEFSRLSAEGAGFGGEQNLFTKRAPFGTVHSIAIVASSSVRLSVDGALQGLRPRGGGAASFAEFRLGARHYSNSAEPSSDSGFFDGDIAELLLYGRALPEAELAALDAYLRKKHSELARGEAALEDPRPPVTMLVPGFAVKRLPVRLTNVNNVDYFPDGRLLALGYDGRLHVLRDTDGDGLEDEVRPYWYKGEGELRGPIGMLIAPEGVYVPSKGRLTLIKDADGDGTADASEVVATGWPEITQAVDTLGVAKDAEGNLYFGLGCANFANAYLIDREGKPHFDIRSERGTILKLSPDRKKREIVCTGVRFTVALAFNRHGDLFATDQEGETWLPGGNPLDELLHILPGRHYGFPPRHPQHLPDVADEPAVVTFGPQHQSTCGLKFNEARPGWKSFGPAAWEGDAIVVGESRGKLWRVPLAKTAAGYVGRQQLIASLSMLAIDAAVSPNGDLVVTCHSGPPDWGTGPKGEGALFKIVHAEPAAPQPVLAWAAGPLEVKVAFDRPIDSAALGKASIGFGEYASAGDRHETLAPPYKVLEEQRRSPRGELKVGGIRLSEDRRTATISTGAHPWLATYALTLGSTDLAYELHGLEASWTPAGKDAPEWTGWIPHPDPVVLRDLARGSAEHERLLGLLERPGAFRYRAIVQLPGKAGKLWIGPKAEILWAGQPLEVTGQVDTGKDLASVARYETDLHPGGQPLRLEHFRVPWAPSARAPKPEGAAPISTFARGDWSKGKALFFGEAKCAACHAIRGDGGKAAPDLTNLVSWDPARVRKEILEPSATINPDYVGQLVELRNGERFAGVVLPEGTDRLRIVDTEAKERIVARADVARLKPSALSIMPDGFKNLGEERLTDLLTFLTQEDGKAPPSRTKAEVDAVLAKCTETAPDPPRPINLVFCTGPKDHGPGEHDYPRWTAAWKELFAKAPGVRISQAFKVPDRGQWDLADVVVLFFMDGAFWTDERLAEIDRLLARGGGLVVMHSAVLPGKEPGKAAERLGICWEPGKSKFRHGPVDLKLADHALTRGVPDLKLVDESYWPLMGDASKVTVLATSVEEGEARPMIWTREEGKGRVYATLLGHYSWTFDDPLYRVLLLRGMAWAAGEPADRFRALATEGVPLR